MNPFSERPCPIDKALQNWRQLYPRPYDKRTVDPYTKTRIILANGAEFEANWFSHQFSRHTDDNDLRRELALTRFIEKQQQQKLSLLKPADETILEHTISYEQLAVDLTAELARKEKDCYVKKTLDFALLEDFDHLYRYADLLQGEQGVYAEKLVGRYTEIMPGRPTISHHRYPIDNVRRIVSYKTADVRTVLATMTITAAEQQTMNYYMNVANFALTDMGRRLYEEIALVEEEHVTQYEDLTDSTATWLEMLLWHEYNECYLYWSCYMTETDRYIKELWEENFAMEISHLHKAAELLKKYPYEISGGQKQRAAVARAIITNPRLLLADEPTGALDSKATDELLRVFSDISRSGQTILMVTHSVRAASRAGRVLFIKDGEVYHQLYRGNLTDDQLYQKITDALTVLQAGGEQA